ncbi:DEAD/DEAH box helicase [Candidatus Tisiphia endosymbiont of Psammoecus bipunctatus]|uniref:DEAD/DEAH box helicase n=2 Tax=Candidatus Tisiphia TaxID=2996317 RepID=UPI0035C92DA1
MKKLTTQEACDVLSAWTVLEILTPQSFNKPEDLVGGNKELVVLLDNTLPWENGGEKLPPYRQLFYQIIIGSINLKNVFSALTKKYGDTNVEAKYVSGEAIMGVIIVDQYGHLIKNDSSVNISSFAWGAPQALKGNLKNLGKWSSTEKDTEIALEAILCKRDKNGQKLPLNKIVIDEAHNYLTNTFEIPAEMLINKQFAIKTYESSKKDTPTKTLLLNSFYLNDLIKASNLIQKPNVQTNLLQYLGVNIPLKRYNILDPSVLQSILSPKNIPTARWPGLGRHPLVLLQQAVVNLSMTELKDSGILAINGPPRTGKTTLLRDIVAKLVTERAEALLKFADPEKAFTDSGHKIKAGQSWLNLYKLDKSLKGFEILIASSNNKAVENISAELPSLKAIANDANDLRYFTVLSDLVFGCKSWGLISAVLGNIANCNNFSKNFWWNNDLGLLTYLAEASGIPQIFEITDPKTGKILERRKPRIIEESDPPHNHSDALRRWRQASTDFKHVLQASRTRLAELQEIKNLVQDLANLESGSEQEQTLEELLLEHYKSKPHVIWRILNTPSFRAWQKEGQRIAHKESQKLVHFDYVKRIVPRFSNKLGSHFIDNNLFSKSHEERHIVSPWCDTQTQSLRDEVFISAIKLHKDFIDAAAKPLRHNLGVLMRNFGGSYSEIDKKTVELLPDLWSSFFLVVPSVSTTFASVGRMLKDLPTNSLGWLLIDEAGQALPQAAVGAIMRTKRAIVTGDPLQIEPVVTLPNNLTKSICEQFLVDPNRFNAPKASVQTLSDTVTSYFSEFNTKDGSRLVGVPLLVHRRCADPMFSISNAIAYGNSMVQAKSPNNSPIRNCLGPSMWFDVQGQALDTWCLEEGKKVVELLYKLKSASIFPNLYIVSPFKLVAGNLRKIIKDHHILESWITTDTNLWLNERIGTIHTVQGREAEAVILVLGAQAPNQNKTRIWAGKSPNILNVAVTRAKEVIYVIGNKSLWKETGVFRELDCRID